METQQLPGPAWDTRCVVGHVISPEAPAHNVTLSRGEALTAKLHRNSNLYSNTWNRPHFKRQRDVILTEQRDIEPSQRRDRWKGGGCINRKLRQHKHELQWPQWFSISLMIMLFYHYYNRLQRVLSSGFRLQPNPNTPIQWENMEEILRDIIEKSSCVHVRWVSTKRWSQDELTVFGVGSRATSGMWTLQEAAGGVFSPGWHTQTLPPPPRCWIRFLSTHFLLEILEPFSPGRRFLKGPWGCRLWVGRWWKTD